jgi:stearoyl-CoA desaturase (delta-9 desaturase)
MNFRLVLLFAQILIHVVFVYGLFKFSLTSTLPVIILCQIIFAGLCGTVFFHRVVTHKNKINPIAENILLALSTIGLSGSALAWAATHRTHHRFSDTEKDPHSPKHIGYFKTYWYSSADATSLRYVPDLLRKKAFLFQHRYYFQINLVYHLIVLFTMPFYVYWAICIVPGFVMWFTGSVTNCLSHDIRGPRNNALLGIAMAGEGWHKNHHTDPSNPSFKSNLDWGHWLYKLVS